MVVVGVGEDAAGVGYYSFFGGYFFGELEGGGGGCVLVAVFV